MEVTIYQRVKLVLEDKSISVNALSLNRLMWRKLL